MGAAAAGEHGCQFCAVVVERVSAHVVAETEHTLSFLDHRPLFPGHTLVVPRAHHRTLLDLPDRLVAPYFAEVRRIAGAVQDALDADGTFVAANNVVSQSVPHLHTHVVPRRRKDGLRGFFWPRSGYESEEHAAAVASQIIAALA